MRSSFELVTALQYELKAAQRQPALFKSGQKYVTMKKEHAQECRRLEQQIKALREELHRLHQEQLYARQQWFESTDDMQAEYERRIRTLQAENARLYERSMKAEAQRDAAYDKLTEMCREKYQLAAELEEEKRNGKVELIFPNNMRIVEAQNFSPVKVKLWMAENCICPESFYEGCVMPGNTVEWMRSYCFGI